jgi:hypothetical protein
MFLLQSLVEPTRRETDSIIYSMRWSEQPEERPPEMLVAIDRKPENVKWMRDPERYLRTELNHDAVEVGCATPKKVDCDFPRI